MTTEKNDHKAPPCFDEQKNKLEIEKIRLDIDKLNNPFKFWDSGISIVFTVINSIALIFVIISSLKLIDIKTEINRLERAKLEKELTNFESKKNDLDTLYQLMDEYSKTVDEISIRLLREQRLDELVPKAQKLKNDIKALVHKIELSE